MTKVPNVSIVMPSYNQGHLIGQAIKSVISQRYKSWELIIVDNTSTDSTVDVIKKYQDPRIKLITVNNNGVIGYSRNIGIKNAVGEWIAFLDTDDIWLKNKLDVSIKCLLDNNADLVYHDLRIRRKNIICGRNIYTKKMSNDVKNDLLIYGNIIGNSSVVVKKEIIEQVNYISEDINMVASEDYNLWLKISELSSNFMYINSVLGYYTVHLDNSSKRDMSTSYLCAVNKYIENCSPDIKKIISARSLLMKADYFYVNGLYGDAKYLYTICYKNFLFTQKIKILLKIFTCMLRNIKYL